MVRKTLKLFFRIVLLVVGFVLLYVLLGLLLPLISIKAEATSDPKSVTIYIITNGVHTDLVLPIENEFFNWKSKIPLENTQSKSTAYQWIAFGWGDKGFYLNTPTWADLKFSTAIKATFWMSESAMHCTFYEKMYENQNCIKIEITENQYKNLIQYIDNKFYKDKNGSYIFIDTDAVYGNNDAFYEAEGTYSFMYTCNTWANYGLKAAGQKYALWSATDFGIFRHYRK
ncbi:TIGR02117 family protein [Capnocytophaga canimorsus]|uniref:TIGR02117 family protein n=1 Tax=Capnocytophaga canimorsus TaxID=28188 RepID=UPI000D6DEDE6|nr:TIGR02117 family protein [Capnocytophaga canimorsus]AWL77945.1 TIGR02117 family protein [Capnocytophaga canimorsus]AYW36574.1 TIGR02117 family protein [Capnocytophaga canimorsus]